MENDKKNDKNSAFGVIPMIEDGPYKILGGSNEIYYYLCKSKGSVAAKMMPPELEEKVKSVMAWHAATMAVPLQ